MDGSKEDRTEFIKNSKLILKTQQRFRSEKHHVFIIFIVKSSLEFRIYFCGTAK